MTRTLPVLLGVAFIALHTSAAPTSNLTARSAPASSASSTVTALISATPSSGSSGTAAVNGTISTAPESAGNIPYSLTTALTEPATSTSFALQPSPTLNGTAEVARLWSIVEAQLPVQTAHRTELKKVNGSSYNFGSEPPTYQPSWLSSSAVNLTFPKGFLFGSASAATQVEGAAKADGKGPSCWDWLCHYMYPEDFHRMRHLGFNVYSFSFAWTRILPLGSGDVNEAGLAFYDAFIDDMSNNSIKPFATLFHWDTPMSSVQRYGSWTTKGDEMVHEFVAYAEVLFRRYGHKIQHWVTMNEPGVFCTQYKGLPHSLYYPEGINSTSAPYQCAYNFLRAHGHTAKLFRDLKKQGIIRSDAEIGFKNDDNWPVPYREGNEDDIRAAQRHADFHIGLYSQPVYGNGSYPASVVATLGDMLPALNESDLGLVRGSASFFAWDGYRTDVARAAPNGIDACAANQTDVNWPICDATNSEIAYGHSFANGWSIGAAGDPAVNWLYNTAPYLRRQLKYLTEHYPAAGGIYLSEFGFSEPKENQRDELYAITWDTRRQEYYRDHLTEALFAIHEDGIDLRGTFAWSILDNAEWNSGLESKFGIQYVNFSSPDLTRSFKLSAYQLRDFGKQHLQSAE